MMKHWPPDEIRAVALEKVLRPLWRRRREFARGAAISPIGLLPIMPDRIITELLGMRLERPEQIPEETDGPSMGSMIGGVIDRRLAFSQSREIFPSNLSDSPSPMSLGTTSCTPASSITGMFR